MLGPFIQFALSQRLLSALMILMLLGIGSVAMLNLPIDAYPDISPTQVKLIIKSPGMTPEEVETLITNPVEVELLGIPDQTILRSISKYALSSITLDFEEGTDIYWARQQVTERLNNIWGDLPGTISGGLAPLSTPLSDMFMFTIDNPSMSLEERRFLLDWTIRPALRTVPGVADVNSLGGFVRTFEVKPQRERMTLLGFTHDDLVQALELNNRNDGAGRLDQGEEAILVRVTGAVLNVEDLGRIQVRNGAGVLLPLSELAEVRLGELERYGAVTADGKEEVVEGLVIGLRGINANDVIKDVRAKLDELQPTLPDGTTINVFYDRSDLVNGAVKTVARALIEAVILVVALLILFLGNVRAALTVAVVLPLSALFTFVLMIVFGMSANLMSLGGLVIAIGMLVDSSIVIVENVVSTMAHAQERRSPLSPLHLVFRAAKDVAVPVASGIFIIMIVFLPLLSLEGLEGKLFRPVTLTIVFALAGSLLLSLTFVPVVASMALRADAHVDPWLSRKLTALYTPLLRGTLRNPMPLLAGAGALLVLTVVLYPFVGKTFMPTMDEGDILVQLESIPSINLRSSTRQTQLVEEAIIAGAPEVVRTVSRLGSDEIGMDPMGLNETDMFLRLKPRDEWDMPDKAALEDRLRAILSGFPGINFAFTQPIDMRVSEMLTGSRGDVAIKIFGTDLNLLNRYANDIAAIVDQVPGSIDTIATINEGAQYLQVEVNRLRAGELGLDADTLQTQLRAEIEGLRVGTVIQGSARVPLMLRYKPLVGDGEIALRQNLITLPDGSYTPMAEVANIARVEGPVQISREAGRRFAVVRTNVEGRDLVGFVEEARQAVAQQLDMENGYTLEWGGEFENQQRAAARLALVVPVALLLIAFILFLTFRSIKQTLIVLSMIPFALTGGLIALWLTGEFLSVPASVGFIALLGIAVLNGVVLLSHFNHLLAKGHDINKVVFEGALRRLRPVMMTASICALGLVPLLLATGPGSEIQKPLAIVVVGGLISSTLLTLFLMPLIYRHFHRHPHTN
ncbi:MAG: CusA/CzcA family heavy metal efflux RND transporter [Pseudomonadales bacterium]|nr:CusA/CzcA family heavy metal efflux RND transporter [Pseudomonadales bacterium]